MPRVFWAVLAVLMLGGAGRPSLEAHLDGLIRRWHDEPVTMLRLRISAEPVVAAMVMWSPDGTRLFPPVGTPPHVTEESMIADLPRLDALRMAADPVSWEKVTRGGAQYYRCTALTCLKVNAPALLEATGQPGATLDALLHPPAQRRFVLPILAVLAVLIAAGLARWRRKPATLPQDPDQFRFGDTTIHPNQMMARNGSHLASLTARDLRLIGLFRDNTGKVLSKDRLYAEGWGRDYLPNSRALEQYILTLRRKLDPDRSQQGPIETVHGQGYRFRG